MTFKKIELAAKDESQNLLEICIQAAKNKCTVGEMTSTMEKVLDDIHYPLKKPSVVFIVKQ